MRQVRQCGSLAPLLGLTAALLAIPSHACAFLSMPLRVPPTFTVHVYNDFGPVVGLRLKVVARGDKEAEALAEAITDEKGIAVFQLQKFLWGSDLFLQPEHSVMGWQSPELYIEASSTKSAIEIPWPSHVLRSRNMRGKIQTQGAPLAHAALSLRGLVSYEEIATTVTDNKGAFQFAGIKPGLYYLQVNGKYTDFRVPQGNIAIFIGITEANENLSIISQYSDCGLDYRSE
jgi:hypothetical protein